ncbi:SRPBCC domain-containing protein [Streptomyces sp. ALI-76-A]|uniref:SRPBCC domain-containing protein n=1 Tax=Streptomyces sp. ALI-76-A TaxID=3025736 RepID=UPI00256EA423|nr:SRPBCC domain-containing protein [Streptomyces sp. ALI-76-A]MDL5202821.1 SRPBCC domain-containing protein [Streptomyces sp. ALI-76-A]
MEHEVFVPVPAERLREALADPALVARAVPGLQQDAGAEPVTGRLKVRVGSHSITYRGSVRISGQDDGSWAVEGDAAETRGTGSVKLALTIRLRETDGGSTLTFDGTASADGRVTELPPAAVSSATARLLSRFSESLGAAAEGERDEPAPGPQPEPAEPAPVVAAEVPPPAPSEDVSEEVAEDISADVSEEVAEDISADVSEDVPEAVQPSADDFVEIPRPPAEAAHARRTMIGRSAEEVDHAPPRGRYAPVPAPQTISPRQTLRWAAPAAAVALASAIAVTRVLRRRR